MGEKESLLKLLRMDTDFQDCLSDIGTEQWSSIIALAGRQHVGAYLCYRLQEGGVLGLIPVDAAKALKQSLKQSTFRNMALMAEFKRIRDSLGGEGIAVIGLKGLQLLQEGTYPHIGLRFLRDLDLLVPSEQIEAAYACTMALGYRGEKTVREFDLFMAHHHHLPQQIHPEKKIILELHSRLENALRIDTAALWERAVRTGNQVFLEPEDLLVHLCDHISYSDLFKIDLRHYLDIYMILRSERIDWEKFLSRIHSQGTTAGMMIVMQIVSKLFHYPLPDSIYAATAQDARLAELSGYAMELMWQYDKSSAGYKQYKSNIFLSDEPLYKRFFHRVFVPTEELSYLYDLSPDTKRVYLFYFRRVYDLFMRHFRDTIRGRIDRQYMDMTAKTKRLHTYLFKQITEGDLPSSD